MNHRQDSSLLADPFVRLILFAGLVIQVISAINAIGYWHPDQHHSIIEFATHKLGITPFELMARELPEQVRQTLQVWVFLAFYKVMQYLHLDNAYTADLVLRLFTSSLNFVLFNTIILRVFKNESRLTLYTLLGIFNFSWTFPYIRTLFSSEIYGGFTYFFAILMYKHFSTHGMTGRKAMLVGFVLSLAFFFRFQMGFAMIGLGIWLLFFERASSKILAGMAVGFVMGTALNVCLDSIYYGELAFTPYTYWKINIMDGRAMGHKPIINYIGVLALGLTAPPLSFMLVVFLFIGLYKKYADPYSLSVIFFLLVHFMVPHKEPRFLFPIVGILPVILGFGLRDFLNWRSTLKMRTAFMIGLEAVILVSMVLNGILLTLLLFVPVAQHIAFSKKLNDYFDDDPVEVVFYQRTPYETPTVQNVATYYLHSKKPNIGTFTVEDRAEFLARVKNHEKGTYFVSTYDRLVKDQLIEEMDCTTLMVSSRLLTRINTWIQEKHGLVLPELWALYECRGTN